MRPARTVRPNQLPAPPALKPPVGRRPRMAPPADSRRVQRRRPGPPDRRRAIPTMARGERRAEAALQAEAAQPLGAGRPMKAPGQALRAVPPLAARPRWEQAALLAQAHARPGAQALRVGLPTMRVMPEAVQPEPVPTPEIPTSPYPASRPRTPAGPSSATRLAVRSRLEPPAPEVAWSAAPRSTQCRRAGEESRSTGG